MKSAFDEFSTETREFSIIGSFLTWKDKIGFINYLEPWMFSIPAASKIFGSIKKIYQDSGKVSHSQIVIDMTDHVNGGYNAEYETFIKNAINAAFPLSKTDIEQFREAAQLRSAKNETVKLIKDTEQGVFSYSQFLDKIDSIRYNFQPISENIKEFEPGTFLDKRLKILQRREESKQVFFGYPSLDLMIPGGQRKKEVSVIASRPGCGKSSLKANLIRSQCELGFRIASIATEQTEEVETDRIDALLTGIPVIALAETPKWEQSDPRIQKIIDANKYIDANWKYYLYVRRDLSTQGVGNWLRRLSDKYGEFDVCYVDLFDRLTDVSVENVTASLIGNKLHYLNQIAEELNIHICVLVQVNRAALKEEKDKRPKLHHLKGSGGYEEVARLVALLHREKYYNSQIVRDEIEINIAKQNNGPSGVGIISKLEFNNQSLLISEKNQAPPNIYE